MKMGEESALGGAFCLVNATVCMVFESLGKMGYALLRP